MTGPTLHHLTLEAATQIADAALAHARQEKLSPLCIVVLDAGGHPVILRSEDGATFMRSQIAAAKANGALGMGYGSRELARRAAAAPVFYTSLFALSGGAMAASPGGVLIRNGGGRVIGAVGVSGDTGDADEACAIVGVRAAGLEADAGIIAAKT